MKLHLVIREELLTGHCKVWLVKQTQGGAMSGRMHGVLSVKETEELAEALGIPVVRETGPFDHPAGYLIERRRETVQGD